MTKVDQPRLLFVYGSLRRGEPMFEELGLERALEFVSEGTFRGNLYDLGDYPGAVLADGVVRGEVYQIKDAAILEILDRYEEFDPDQPERSLFIRERVNIPEAGEAWIYLYNGSSGERRPIVSGDWRDRRSAA
ncbi:MAG TPA: gamma-glutamylcyclotransferase family protein [Allosphingosinicella sp.]